MKKIVLAGLLSLPLLAQAENTHLDWTASNKDGSFTKGTITVDLTKPSLCSHDVCPNDSLPFDESHLNDCSVTDTLDHHGINIHCGGTEWTFKFTRFSCLIGGGGKWDMHDHDPLHKGAFLCNPNLLENQRVIV